MFLEIVGQIIPCTTHGIICPTIYQKGRTGYALSLQQGKSSKLFFFANVANDSTRDFQSVSNFIELDEFISTTKWYSPVRFVNFYSHKILHKAGYEKPLKQKSYEAHFS